jgi:uncharacterized protein YjbI with pentapeptide repeats
VTDRAELRADCARCVALCCVAPAFARSSEFAIDKPAGTPCPHLGGDDRCMIHQRLRDEGFPGCTAYDCFGAGQRLAQETFAGADWRRDPQAAAAMFAALPVLRGLHELIWYVEEARALDTSWPLRAELEAVRDACRRRAASPGATILDVDLAPLRQRAGPLLRQASRLARASHPGPDHAGDDLSGADLRAADLRGACFRGALLIGARLDDADLTRADLLGADLRGADLRGARLAGALFVTRTQVGGASGDRRTTLPRDVERPGQWAG